MTLPKRPGCLAARLCYLGGSINLAYHDIVRTPDEVRSAFDVTTDSFAQILEWCRGIDISGRTRLYFDDNHRSLYDLVLKVVDPADFLEVVAAVPVNSVSKAGRGGISDIDGARAVGVRVAPHGCSHVRLASYDPQGNLLPTPLRGPYADRQTEESRPLTENEVLFQLVESKEYFKQLASSEFVLPYGCYNQTTIALNQRLAIYDTLTTADFDIDTGQEIRPRLTVKAADTADTIERVLNEVTAATCPNIA
jgi:hypothetical protein